MFAAQESVSKFIVVAHQKPGLLHDMHLEQAVEDFLDILKSRVGHKSLAELCASLRERMFSLRIEAIRWLPQAEIPFQKMQRLCEEKIKTMAQQSNQHHLIRTTHLVLQQYGKIVSPYLKGLGDSELAQLAGELSREKPDYGTIKMFGLHPDPRTRFVKNWIDQSLDLEIGWIVADLVLLQEIEHPAQELISFLEQSIARFGAYSMFTGFWSPDDPNEDALTRKAKILAATLELDLSAKNKRISPETFHQMLQN